MFAAYIRVSSRKQKSDSQRAEITKWFKGNGIDMKQVRWYEDKESGKSLARPAFDQLQADIFSGKIKTVVVWKLDRLSRRLRDGINLLGDWFDRGLRFISVTQQIELNGAVGRMIAALMFGLAEIEREHIRERQAAGIALAKKRRIYTGRQQGTTKKKPARAIELRQKGLQINEISEAMDVSVRTVHRYLHQC
jgi:DNA invertase Pin-like site-specific DNA recombinase